MTLSIPDGLIFALFGSEAGWQNDLTLYGSCGWGTVLEVDGY